MVLKAYKKIEYYLYNYNLIDIKINNLLLDISDSEYNQNYKKWIKNKSSSLEDQVIRNIDIERKVHKLKKWKHLITLVLHEYKTKNELKYNFINLKYFEKLKPLKIKDRLNLSLKEQEDIRIELVRYIFSLSVKKNMLRDMNYGVRLVAQENGHPFLKNF